MPPLHGHWKDDTCSCGLDGDQGGVEVVDLGGRPAKEFSHSLTLIPDTCRQVKIAAGVRKRCRLSCWQSKADNCTVVGESGELVPGMICRKIPFKKSRIQSHVSSFIGILSVLIKKNKNWPCCDNNSGRPVLIQIIIIVSNSRIKIEERKTLLFKNHIKSFLVTANQMTDTQTDVALIWSNNISHKIWE